MAKYLQQNLLKMIKKTLLSIVFLSCYAYGQETYFEVGVNNTSYDYTYQSTNNDFELDPSPGIFIRVGIGELLPNLNYGLSYHQNLQLFLFHLKVHFLYSRLLLKMLNMKHHQY